MYLNREPVAPATLETQLQAAFAGRTDRTLYLKADEGLAYGAVMDTMDRVRRAGIDRLGMVTDPPVRER
jgi:biopolymer transport protein TolR